MSKTWRREKSDWDDSYGRKNKKPNKSKSNANFRRSRREEKEKYLNDHSNTIPFTVPYSSTQYE